MGKYYKLLVKNRHTKPINKNSPPPHHSSSINFVFLWYLNEPQNVEGKLLLKSGFISAVFLLHSEEKKKQLQVKKDEKTNHKSKC